MTARSPGLEPRKPNFKLFFVYCFVFRLFESGSHVAQTGLTSHIATPLDPSVSTSRASGSQAMFHHAQQLVGNFDSVINLLPFPACLSNHPYWVLRIFHLQMSNTAPGTQ